MLVSLARYHKSIAWFFTTVFYLQFVLVPVMARSESGYSRVLPRTTGVFDPRSLTAYANTNAGTAPGEVVPKKGMRGNASPLIPRVINKPIAPAPDGGGPGQPEMAAFTAVGSSNMVDLFTGDFSYNIPLMDVGGYPINIAYRAGVGMDQEASWVGLGWNVNPGTITRNMRGLPDDFNGVYDSTRKTMHVKQNQTTGVTAGGDVELVGLPKNDKGGTDTVNTGITVGTSIGITYNNYRGWGIEHAINASINSGKGAHGPLSGGLSITNSSMDGLTVSPSFSVNVSKTDADNNASTSGSFSIFSGYNTRSGLKALQMGLGESQSKTFTKNQKSYSGSAGGGISSVISFNSPSYTPTISMPYTSFQYSFTAKVGTTIKVIHPSFYVSGYVSAQGIDSADTEQELPSYGYLYYRAGAQNASSLLDYNREKELPYRESPAMPHIAIPAYTYDAFSIAGEGIGGMFRAYRGDIGFVHDHFMRTKDNSDKLSLDIGVGDLVHGGIDLNITRAFTQTGPWLNQNALKESIGFRKDSADFQAVYFRNPGEKSINDKAFYETLGGDDVVTAGLFQSDRSSGILMATNYLRRFKGGRPNGQSLLNRNNAVKAERDKRTQVITYLNAQEADAVGLSKYIEYRKMNSFFNVGSCKDSAMNIDPAIGSGLVAEYFPSRKFKGTPYKQQKDGIVQFDWGKNPPPLKAPFYNPDNKAFPRDQFSVRWLGRIKPPQTGRYTFFTRSDDGSRVWINDSLVVNNWRDHSKKDGLDSGKVNLVAGTMYTIRVEHFEDGGDASITFDWRLPQQSTPGVVPMAFLFPPPAQDTIEQNNVVRELRVNSFRKPNHISEIDVLSTDGRRYVYGIPVYNLRQKEASFSVNKDSGDRASGLAGYKHGTDNTIKNKQGRDNYFSSEETSSYAHSFLLTGILSADYSDITGNGISDDDIGDAVKFNYTKTNGIRNPYQWRVPAEANKVTYNEALRTDSRDDKGNYIYGEKELWYLHSIESKTMVATFTLAERNDLPGYNEAGSKTTIPGAKLLKEINLYSKSDVTANSANLAKVRPVKTVHFEYSYELCPGAYGPGTGKLTLKKIWFTYNGNSKGAKNLYVFNYNSKNPAYDLHSNDRWGTYKDPLQNPGSTTGNVIINADYPYALQDSLLAAQNAAAWSLDSISLPSGGSLKVQYESDDYAFVQNRRSAQLFRVLGAGATSAFASSERRLYRKKTALEGAGWEDYRYVFVRIPKRVNNIRELYYAYLEGIDKLYFKLSVRMPSDNYGSGYENIPCYADLEKAGGYGIVNDTVMWVKIQGINLKGDGGGSYSPLVKASTQFLRLNLPSKAYPGSETGDQVDLAEAIKLLLGMVTNVTNAVRSFDAIARNNKWGADIDTARTFIRLNNPFLQRMGGGHRVKRIIVYDNWDKMTNQRAAVYGQEYTYKTLKTVDTTQQLISSGVAVYEPGIGGEENPLHKPLEYVEKIAPLGPVTMGYSEEPLGESFFPGASVGYSKVRVRTINYKKKKSANGYDETCFYTAYDFPIYTDKTLLDDDSKKRYKPTLANLLRVNARHYLAFSQGFKVELNDMHGKMRSSASYPETDSSSAVSYSEQFYKTDNASLDQKRLSNIVTVMKPDGSVDTAALIGKDVELMVDMREQQSVTNGYNINLNSDQFTVPFIPPWFIIPSLLNLAQREENIFKSVATTKIIQRYGILDSAIQVDKGSRVSTRNLVYDSETGDVLLTRTQNEFNDPVYNFSYPSHWAYEGMGLAYKNIDVRLDSIDFRSGRIAGMTSGSDMEKLFSSGDEILVAGRQKTGGADCAEQFATFPDYDKIWAVDSSVLYGGTKSIYFIDRWGKPYNAGKTSIRIIRSGRRNILGAVGSITSLDSLIKKNTTTHNYELVVNTGSKIIAASAGEFRQFWKTDDLQRKQPTVSCIPIWQPNDSLRCLKSGGINTGYQVVGSTDINPLSSSYNTNRYDTIYNCYECSLPAQWAPINDTICAQDSAGNNLGYRLRGEEDTATCSKTYGQKRWQIVLAANCTICPKPAKWVLTGVDSCAKDTSGNKTGYQLKQERDTAACSATYNQLRWTYKVLNCTACSKPAIWQVVADSVQCLKDGGGNNTGYIRRLYINMQGCSDSAYQYKWVIEAVQNCALCSMPAGWKITGNVRCVQSASVNTGMQEREERDTSTCSATYNQLRWVSAGQNCTTCPKPKNWQYIDSFQCEKVSGVNTGYRQRWYKNMELCSDSGGLGRWVRYDLYCDSCKKPKNWQNTDSFRCVKSSGVNTGYQERRQLNMEACSDSGSMERWVPVGLNCTACRAWTTTGISRCQKTGESADLTQERSSNAQFLSVPIHSGNTGYWEEAYTDHSACGVAGDTMWVRTYQDTVSCPLSLPCNSTTCSGVDRKCINGICEIGMLTCFSSVFVSNSIGWNNCYRYYFSDGTWSSFNVCQFEPDACSPPIGYRTSTIKNHTEKKGSIVKADKKATKEELFYKTVLPEEKYMLYRQQTGNAPNK